MSKIRDFFESESTIKHQLHSICCDVYGRILLYKESLSPEKKKIIFYYDGPYKTVNITDISTMGRVYLSDSDDSYAFLHVHYGRSLRCGDYEYQDYYIPDTLLTAYDLGTESYDRALDQYMQSLQEEMEEYYSQEAEKEKIKKDEKELEERKMLQMLKEKYHE